MPRQYIDPTTGRAILIGRPRVPIEAHIVTIVVYINQSHAAWLDAQGDASGAVRRLVDAAAAAGRTFERKRERNSIERRCYSICLYPSQIAFLSTTGNRSRAIRTLLDEAMQNET